MFYIPVLFKYLILTQRIFWCCRPYDRDSTVEELRKQLREKDLVLTDIRLEALSSAHQLESLKDTVIKMRVSMEGICLINIFKMVNSPCLL